MGYNSGMDTKRVLMLSLTMEQIRDLPTTPVEICQVPNDSVVDIDALTGNLLLVPVDPLDSEAVS